MSLSNEDITVIKKSYNTDFIGPPMELSELQETEMRLVSFINDRDVYYKNLLEHSNIERIKLQNKLDRVESQLYQLEATILLSDVDKSTNIEIITAKQELEQAEEHAKAEAQAHAEAEAEAQAHAEAEAEAHAHAEAEAEAQAQAQAQAQAHAEAEAQAQAHAEAEAQAQAHAEAEAQAHAEAEAEAEAESEEMITIILKDITKNGIQNEDGTIKEGGIRFIKGITKNFIIIDDENMELEDSMYDNYLNVIIRTNKFKQYKDIPENLRGVWYKFQEFIYGDIDTFELKYKNYNSNTFEKYTLIIKH